MTHADLERFRATLMALRERLTGDVSFLTEEAFRSVTDQDPNGFAEVPDPTDQGPDVYEHEFTFSLLQNQERTLEEIDEALERMRRGLFGRCEECSDAITRPRLQALPYARHCVRCARKLQ
ncbi:MAG: TraR/DksA family transcriptional regulator [Gemmataceae bacterium]